MLSLSSIACTRSNQATQFYMRSSLSRPQFPTNIASKCSDLTPVCPNPNNCDDLRNTQGELLAKNKMIKITWAVNTKSCCNNCSGAAASWFLCIWCISFPFGLDLDSSILQTGNRAKMLCRRKWIGPIYEMGCTSGFESVSESLCLISLAIEKKTCSTFRFVFALWGKKINNKLCIRNKSNVRHMYLEKSDINYQLSYNKGMS